MEAVEHERNKTKNIEMNRAGRIPSAEEDEKPYEEIQRGGEAQVVPERRGVFLRRSNERYLERFAIAADSVADFRPWTRRPKDPHDIRGAMDLVPADGFDVIALFDSCIIAGTAGDNMPSDDALSRVHPGDAVIGDNESRTLLEIQNGKNNCRYREESESNSPQPYSQM